MLTEPYCSYFLFINSGSGGGVGKKLIEQEVLFGVMKEGVEDNIWSISRRDRPHKQEENRGILLQLTHKPLKGLQPAKAAGGQELQHQSRNLRWRRHRDVGDQWVKQLQHWHWVNTISDNSSRDGKRFLTVSGLGQGEDDTDWELLLRIKEADQEVVVGKDRAFRHMGC